MLEFKSNTFHQGNKKNDTKIPIKITGKSTFNKPVLIKTAAACGCTDVVSNFMVQPNSDFTITGNLSRRPRVGTHSKKITVTALEGKKQLDQKTIQFTVNVV